MFLNYQARIFLYFYFLTGFYLFGTEPRQGVAQIADPITLAPDVEQWIKERFVEQGFTVEIIVYKDDCVIPLMECSLSLENPHVYLFLNEAAVDASHNKCPILEPEEWMRCIKNAQSESEEEFQKSVIRGFNYNTIKAIALHELGHRVFRHDPKGVVARNIDENVTFTLSAVAFCAGAYLFMGTHPLGAFATYAVRGVFALHFGGGCASATNNLLSRHFSKDYHPLEYEADSYIVQYGDPVLILAAQRFFEYFQLIFPQEFSMAHPGNLARAAYFKKSLEELKG